MTAAAGVHRGDELKPCGIDNPVIGAGDGDFAGFERLAQRIENLSLKFGQFVEEQDALMGERDFARPGMDPPPTSAAIEAEWCGARKGRRSVNAPPANCPATEWMSETSSNSRGISGGRIDGSRAASMDLPAPGGPFINKLWPPAAAISSARLALS